MPSSPTTATTKTQGQALNRLTEDGWGWYKDGILIQRGDEKAVIMRDGSVAALTPHRLNDAEIIDQTNAVARAFYRQMGYEVAEGYRFDRAHHPQEICCWQMACIAQDHLTGTDVDNALAELNEA